MLISMSETGCLDTMSMDISIFETTVVTVPNIFTPNSDDKNDLFFVTGAGIATLKCEIFNRWGKKIHAWDDITGSWDGIGATPGNYYYSVSIVQDDGDVQEIKGWVTLAKD